MVPESLHAPAVCCSAWFGVPRYQNRPHGFLVAAGSPAPELPGLPPADARCDRSCRAIEFGIGGSSGEPVEKEIKGRNPALPDDDEISPRRRRRLTTAA